MKFLPAFSWILKLKRQTVLIRIYSRSPPESLVWNVRVSVFSNDDITRFMNDSMFFYVLIAEEKITSKVSLKPPEYINRNRYKINQLERLTTSFFRLDSVKDSLLAKQFFSIRFNCCRMNRHTDETI
jgi:hypothetical protein